MCLLAFLFTVILALVFNLGVAEIEDTSFLKKNNSLLWPITSPKTPHELTFRLYLRGSSPDEPTETCAGSCKNITFKKISIHNPIKIIIHGWHGYGKCVFYEEILKAYLGNIDYSDYNLITVDWSSLGSKNLLYPYARAQVPVVASMFATFLNSLKTQLGVQLENVHIIGHSLGAHIAGVAAYHLTSGKIGRITGLDPAGPMFSLEAYRERLSTDSALFVDVIHSSYGFIGIGATIGHVDFIPNGPQKLQPGCGIDLIGRCSHRRSFYWYAESISRPKAFLAVPCLNWLHYLRKQCDFNDVVPMGESTPTTARRVYYLSTNKYSPFGKGTKI